MMGRPQRRNGKLFYTGLNLDQRVRANHPLRAIAKAIDFSFVRGWVKHLYGRRGNPSVDPTVLLKLLFLLFYEQVPSERALMERLSERLDWLWFCGYDLDDTIPDHSVISKARKRWGPKIFAEFFQEVLARCMTADLVDGELVHVDASIQAADADRNRLVPALRVVGHRLYEQLDRAQEDVEPGGDSSVVTDEACPPRPLPKTPISPTDPDARLTRKNNKSVLGYKDHRVVDDAHGIITATHTTDAATKEQTVFQEVLDRHEQNVQTRPKTVVADKTYGTADNYKALSERGISPCIPHARRGGRDGRFSPERFEYDPKEDCYLCPGGHKLYRCPGKAQGRRYRYIAPAGLCDACPLQPQCTKAGTRRRVSRHVDQSYIDWADSYFTHGHRRRLLRRRQWRIEGSFGDAANRHGYKRARWRELWRMTIQNLLIATIQNVRKLVKYAQLRKGSAVAALPKPDIAPCHLAPNLVPGAFFDATGCILMAILGIRRRRRW